MPLSEAPAWPEYEQHVRDDSDLYERRRALEWSDDDFDLIPATVVSRRVRGQDVRSGRFQRRAAQDSGTAEVIVLRRDGASSRAPHAHRDSDWLADVVPFGGATDAGAHAIAPRPPQGPSDASARGRVERRMPRTTAERVAGHRPDRIAMWAAVFGLLLLLVALSSTAPTA